MQRTRRDKRSETLPAPIVSGETMTACAEAVVSVPAAVTEPTEPAPEARPRLDHVGQARPLLVVQRVVHLRHETDERLAHPLELGVVAREQLAQQHGVEAGFAERVGDVAARAARLAAQLPQRVA